MVIEYGEYKAEPYGNGRCWQLHKLSVNKKTGEEYWRALDCYPQSLAHLVELMYERILQEDGEREARPLEKALARADEIAKDLKKAAQKAAREAGVR